MSLFTRGNILQAMLKEKQNDNDDDDDEKEDSSNDSSDESSSEVAKPSPMAPKIPSISDIGVTFFYNDHKRSDFRMQHATRITCESYKLENNEDRRHILILKPSAASQRNEEGKPEDITAYSNFEQDIDYISRLCENQAIGFSLDDIMTALYGHVLKPSSKSETSSANRRRGRKASSNNNNNAEQDTQRDAEDDAERSNDPSVCYFKRLAQTATYTGLSVSRLAPIAASSYSKSEAFTMNALSRHGKDHDFEKDEAEALKKTLSEARNARRAMKANIRILPVHFLPQFLITQRVSVQKANNSLSLCFNLLRDMERLSRAFSNNRLYLYTVQQLRANFTHVISDINFRAISATEVMHQMGQWERERQQMREQFHRMGSTIGNIVDTLTVTEEDVKNVFLKQIAPKMAQFINEATEKFSTTLLKIDIASEKIDAALSKIEAWNNDTATASSSPLDKTPKRPLSSTSAISDEPPQKRRRFDNNNDDDNNNKKDSLTIGSTPVFVGWSNAAQMSDTKDVDLISLNEEDEDADAMLTDDANLNPPTVTPVKEVELKDGDDDDDEILEDLF